MKGGFVRYSVITLISANVRCCEKQPLGDVEPDWVVDLTVRLFRNKGRSNRATRAIWAFLEVRESVPLLAEA